MSRPKPKDFTAAARAKQNRVERAGPALLEACKQTKWLLELMRGSWPGTMSITAAQLEAMVDSAIALADPH